MQLANIPGARYCVMIDGWSTVSGPWSLATTGVIAPRRSCEVPLFQSGAFTCPSGFVCGGPAGARTCLAGAVPRRHRQRAGDGLADYPFDPGYETPGDDADDHHRVSRRRLPRVQQHARRRLRAARPTTRSISAAAAPAAPPRASARSRPPPRRSSRPCRRQGPSRRRRPITTSSPANPTPATTARTSCSSRARDHARASTRSARPSPTPSLSVSRTPAAPPARMRTIDGAPAPTNRSAAHAVPRARRQLRQPGRQLQHRRTTATSS